MLFGGAAVGAQRQFELAEYAWIVGLDPGLDAQYFFGSGSIPAPANNNRGGNYLGYRNADVDRLLAAGLATLDQKERAGIYQDLQRLVMDDLPVLPLFYVPNVSAASDRLVNFRPPVGSTGETWNVEQWDLR